MSDKCRSADCYHHCDKMSVCNINGCPCDDGIDGRMCECFLDRSERPSEKHRFDLGTGEWKRTYTVRVTVTVSEDIDVEAENASAAEDAIRERLHNGELDVASMSVDGEDVEVINFD